MTEDPGRFAREYATAGREHRSSRRFSEAGDQYTFAAYAGLARSEFADVTKLSSAVYWLLCSGLCYRLSGNLDRARNRCRQGILIAEDLRSNAFRDDALRDLRNEEEALAGLSYEYVGDFRLLGDIEGHSDSYERAEKYYDRVENHLAWNSELEFTEPMLFVANLIEYLEYPVDPDRIDAALNTSLHARLEIKRSVFPDVIERVCEAGHWDPGTVG